MSTFEQPLRYPTGTDARLGVDPALAGLRARCPLPHIQLPYGRQARLVTRYADAKAVLTDRRFSRARQVLDAPRLMATPRNPRVITSIDPPEHSRVRGLAAKAFSPARIRLLHGKAEQTALELVDDMITKGAPADLVADLARPLPLAMICGMLGVEPEDRAAFRGWTDDMLLTAEEDRPRAEQAMGALYKHIVGLVAQRREREHDDLLSDLVNASDDTGRLSDEELNLLAVSLLAAGYETTSTMIVNAVYLLFTHPEQFDLLRADPGLLPRAVEEFLRYAGITGVDQARIALEDVELASGPVKAGEAVVVSLESANRDEDVFPHADRLDLTREHNQHLSFSHGPHYCIGAQLARMELTTALEALLARTPGLRCAVPVEEIEWVSGSLARRPVSLPVAW